MNSFFTSDIKFLKGVGGVRTEVLGKELGFFTFQALLHYYQLRFVDRYVLHRIADIDHDTTFIQIKEKSQPLVGVGSPTGQVCKHCLGSLSEIESQIPLNLL